MFGSRPTQPNPVRFFHDEKKNVQVFVNNNKTLIVPVTFLVYFVVMQEEVL